MDFTSAITSINTQTLSATAPPGAQSLIDALVSQAGRRSDADRDATAALTNGASNGTGLPTTGRPRRLTPEEIDDQDNDLGYVLPHEQTFSSIYNSAFRVYNYFFDESLRSSWENSLAMRRDGFVHELLRHRQLPTVSLDHHMDCDDPEDDEQVKVCGELDRIITATRRLQNFKLQQMESIFYGKSGSQISLGRKTINNIPRVYVKGHRPVNGDKITFDYDGVPGILVHSAWGGLKDENVSKYVRQAPIGRALFLNDPWFRQRFVINQFEPADTDFTFESDKAGAVHGLGVRDRFFWTWNMIVELLGWDLDALQRMGTNGMLFGFYQQGNPTAQKETLNALVMLMRNNVCAFPTDGQGNPKDRIGSIPPAGEKIDAIFNIIQFLMDIMRRGVLGQNLSSESSPTGLGSNLADLHASQFEHIILFDSKNLAETIDEDLVPVIKKYNYFEYKGRTYRGDDLPFGTQFKFEVDRENVLQLIQAAQLLYDMQVPMDMEDLRDKAGIAAPKQKAMDLAARWGQAQQVNGNGRTQVAPGGPAGGSPPTGRLRGVNGPNMKPRMPGASVNGDGDVERHASQDDEMEFFDASHVESSDPGVMIALRIPPDAAHTLAHAIPDSCEGRESSEHLHITLAYLGRRSEIGPEVVQLVNDIVKTIAENNPPIAAQLGGVGRFSASQSSDGKDVIYASVDAPRLNEFRAEVVKCLRMAQIPFKENHGFTPHVTLAYVGVDEETPVRRLEGVSVRFDGLAVVEGDVSREYRFAFDDGIKSGSGSGSGYGFVPEHFRAWDESKHPRGQPENKGEFGPGQHGRQDTEPGDKGKFVGQLVGKAEHVYADEREREVARMVGGHQLDDNEPLDVRVKTPAGDHAIEVKSLLKGSKQSISVHPDALLRKVDHAAANPGTKFHTVVIDHRHRYAGGAHAGSYSGHDLYYRRGSGRYSLSTMHKVKDREELRRLIMVADSDLPTKAVGSLPSGESVAGLREAAVKAHEARLTKDRLRKQRLKLARVAGG